MSINDSTETNSIIQEKVFFDKYIPIITGSCCVIAILLFIGANLESSDALKNIVAPDTFKILNGDIWGFITNNFLHVHFAHIFFNIYWFWIFGKKIEFEQSKIFYLVFILSSALVSSLAQISIANESGIGLSGIGYAFFGYIYVKGKYFRHYANYIDSNTSFLFIVWLFACILLTQLDILNIGNAAHFGGMLWGALLGYLSTQNRVVQIMSSVLVMLVLASSIFWSPFSTAWLKHEAYQLHTQQKLNEAIIVYKEILTREPESEFAKANLKQLEIHELCEKAYQFHKDGKYPEAMNLYHQILEIDPDNVFAKENLTSIRISLGIQK
jgi:GlpG protein